MSNQRVLSLLSILVVVSVSGASLAAAAAATAAASPGGESIQKRSDDGSSASASASMPFLPMVNLDHKDNTSNLDVHVPIFFDMTKNDGPDKSKLDLSVMKGMVTVNRDKARQANGNLQGPLTVTVFGIPVYTGVSMRRSPLDKINDLVTSAERKLMGEPSAPSSSSSSASSSANPPTQERQTAEKSDQQPGPMRDMLSSMKSANEKVIGTLSSLLSKMSKFLEHQAEGTKSKPSATTPPTTTPPTADSQSGSKQQKLTSTIGTGGPTEAVKEMTTTSINNNNKSLNLTASSSDIASQVMTKVGHT